MQIRKRVFFLSLLFGLLHFGAIESRGTTFLIYATNGLFYAENEATQKPTFVNADAATLLNQLIGISQCQAITLSSGDYPINTTLNLKSDFSLIGLDNARLVQESTGNLIFGTAITNCQISNLELSGGGTNIPGKGIYLLTNCKSNSLTHLYIHDFDGDGILFGDPDTQYNIVIGNCVSNCMGGAGIGFGNGAGDAIIESNFVYRTRFHGIIISTGGSRCLVAHNTVSDAGYYINIASNDFAHGIAADGGGGARMGTGNVIMCNVISNSAMAGIEVADWQNDCAITQNRIYGTGLGMYGIYFGGGLAPSTNCVIISNIVQNADGNGIMVDSPGNGEKGITSNVQIRGNIVRNSNNDGILIGIANNVIMIDNACQNNARSSFGDWDGIHVEGRVQSAGGQLTSVPSKYIVIFGNQCFDDTNPPRQRYGVFLNYVSHAWVCANTINPNTLTPERIGPLFVGSTTNMVTITP